MNKTTYYLKHLKNGNKVAVEFKSALIFGFMYYNWTTQEVFRLDNDSQKSDTLSRVVASLRPLHRIPVIPMKYFQDDINYIAEENFRILPTDDYIGIVDKEVSQEIFIAGFMQSVNNEEERLKEFLEFLKTRFIKGSIKDIDGKIHHNTEILREYMNHKYPSFIQLKTYDEKLWIDTKGNVEVINIFSKFDDIPRDHEINS